MPKVLFLYSNPPDTPRIRLDKEHKAIENLIQELRLDPSCVRRLHATTISDLVHAVQDVPFDVVHFSGHGSPDGFFLESDRDGISAFISAVNVSKVLHESDGQLKAAVFMSCFSAEAVSKLVSVAPFLVTVVGPAGDEASIRFAHAFYKTYFTSDSIERAFGNALLDLEFSGLQDSLKPVLTRRGLGNPSSQMLVQVFPPSMDSLLIDITEAQPSIAHLGVPTQEFLRILTRKMRVHRFNFEVSRERAFIPIGRYFGVFSWSGRRDVIRCHEIMAIRDEIDEDTCSVWASLSVQYNDLSSAQYRMPSHFIGDLRALKRAIEKCDAIFTYFFLSERADVIRKACPQEFKAAKATIQPNLLMAGTKLHDENEASCIQYLEIALSTLHDLVDALATHVLKASE